MGINRRDFLRHAAGAASAAALAAAVQGTETSEAQELPSPSASQIEHIIVVMMENRSFDHFLGWLPGANGTQAGLSYLDSTGEAHPTWRLTTDVGCSHPDPDHSYAGGRSEYDDGKMDGWLRTTTNDVFCIGYYEESDLPFLSAAARNFTTCDNYFASILSSTFPNRVFQHAAQTDRLSNTLDISTLPTIWDTLAAAGISHRYYYSNVPFLALWGVKYLGISALYEQFLLDAALGNLPAVSFLDPKYTILDDGEGNDDHPHANIEAGEAFLSQVYKAVTLGPGWKNTVLIINRDEWGGFYDTVTPPRVIAPNAVDTDLVNGKALLGCRVPTIVVSPWSRGNPATPRIDSALYDHTSVLKLIEWRYNLPPLTVRDASNEIASLAHALNFSSPDFSVPSLPLVTPPIPTPCGLFELGSQIDNESYDFNVLKNSELTQGWTLP
ncbi:MAG TPA: alkaline phosphatase family protein [Acidobacteriaceae bacterium]|jgi:phospholipase C|nr:alkaline phosphatase family protein [Acidobacteriaceae bacterium]